MSARVAIAVASVDCWAPGCRWHATGTDLFAVADAGDQHVMRHSGEDVIEGGVFDMEYDPSTYSTVGLHVCEQLDKDRPSTPARECP